MNGKCVSKSHSLLGKSDPEYSSIYEAQETQQEQIVPCIQPTVTESQGDVTMALTHLNRRPEVRGLILHSHEPRAIFHASGKR